LHGIIGTARFALLAQPLGKFTPRFVVQTAVAAVGAKGYL